MRALLGVVLLISLAGSVQAAPKIPDVATVALTTVNVREGPGTQYPVAFQLRKGERVHVDSIRGDWCMINSSEGLFVQCRHLAPPRGGWVEGRTVSRSCWPDCGD